MSDKLAYNQRNQIVSDVSDATVWGTTVFNERVITEKSQQFILNSNLPLSSQRDVVTVANGGTIIDETAEYRLRAATTANSSAQLESQQRGNYISGNESEAGIGVRMNALPTGDAFIRFGYYKNGDTRTGLYFEVTSEGIFACIEDEGVTIKTHQSEWNINTLLDDNSFYESDDGHVFQIKYVYYGYGSVTYEIGQTYDINRYATIPVHMARKKGAITLSEPNLPLTVEVNSGTSGVQLDVYVGGRQVSTYGKNSPAERKVGAYRLEKSSIGTTFVPMISFKEKVGRESILTRLSSVEVLADADLIYELRWNATLTGAVFGAPNNYSAAECATEWDISATAVSGGETRKSGLILGANKNALTSVDLIERKIYEEDTVTLCVRRVSGINATATAHVELMEAW